MASYIPEGHQTLTGYPVVQDAPALIEFLKTAFDAEEKFRTVGSAGGIHAEVRLGGRMLMLGGGGPGLKWSGESRPMAFHLTVPDVDTKFKRAIKAGAVAISPPADQFWGERTANVEDAFGNYWYLGMRTGKNFIEDLPALQPYLHGAEPQKMIDFLSRAFGAEELGRHTSPGGHILHTTEKFGDSTLEISQAAGRYQPMPSMFYLYVPDVDAAYNKALQAGATSISVPADQPYGDRTGAVTDPFGNSWYLATHLG